MQLYSAGIESRVFKNAKASRDIFEVIVKSNAKEAEYIIEYTNMER